MSWTLGDAKMSGRCYAASGPCRLIPTNSIEPKARTRGGVFRTPGLRPIIMGRGVPRYGLRAAAGGSGDGMAGAQVATRLLFQGKCHNGGNEFLRLEFTIRDDSFCLPNHPEATSVYDAKSGDEAKIANCSPETLERFLCWGAVGKS